MPIINLQELIINHALACSGRRVRLKIIDLLVNITICILGLVSGNTISMILAIPNNLNTN
jgi:hypothetical protein